MIDFLADPLYRGLFLAGLFLAVTGIAFYISRRLERRVAVRSRLDETMGVRAIEQGRSTLRQQSTGSAWTTLVNAIESSGLSLADTKGDTLRKKMVAAGYTSPEAPRVFTLLRLVMTFALPGLFLLFSYMTGERPSLFKLYFFGCVLALLGLYLPNLFVTAKADRRRAELVNGFPDALDLMLVCVEAGLGLEAAFDRVGREMSVSHPLVAQMLGNVVLELRAGRAREDALRAMAERVEVDEIRSFAMLLIQSDKLGSSIGQTLRVYAAEMREKRRLRAEEKAHRLPVLLSIPLVTCMLPVMIGVLMLPAAIRVIRDLVPAMAR
ncbi:MAG: type II secretion system F family protein [Sphingomonadaceae bacterium]